MPARHDTISNLAKFMFRTYEYVKLLKYILAIQNQTTNEPTARKSLQIRQTTGEDLGYLNLEISKYFKQESPIKIYCFIFVSCFLFGFLNIKRVKIYN